MNLWIPAGLCRTGDPAGGVAGPAIRAVDGQGGRTVVEHSPVQLPRRMPVGQRRDGGECGQAGRDVPAGVRGAGEGDGQGPPVRNKQESWVDPFGHGLPLRAPRLAITDDRLALDFGRDAHDLCRNGPPPGRGRGVEPRGQQLGSVSGHPLPADPHTAEQRDPVTVRTAGAGSIGHETSPSSPSGATASGALPDG
jgi:hypothetical protein